MNNWHDVLHTGAAQLGLTISAEEESQLACYLDLLLKRNAQMNLTAITDPVEVAVKHFVDSLTVETIWHPQPGDRALDIGTGAGLPGIPLAIRHPDVRMTLNDSTRKKVDFLNEVIAALHLNNTRAVWARAEELGRDREHRGQYNVVFARAVAHLAVLVEYALPLLKLGGILIAMKGPSGVVEVQESANALKIIGGELVETRQITLAGAGERLLIAVRKAMPTPDQFPRNPGYARKHPLYPIRVNP